MNQSSTINLISLPIVAVASGGALDGDEKPARLAVCGKCRSSFFYVIFIENHIHLQCRHCQQAFCAGDNCE